MPLEKMQSFHCVLLVMPFSDAKVLFEFLTSDLLQVTWSPPQKPNGRILRYEIIISGLSPAVVNATGLLVFDASGLVPWTSYTVSVRACTAAGCTGSPEVFAKTLASAPEALDPPEALVVTRSLITVRWKPPRFPNGPSISYLLQRKKVRQPLNKSA